MFLATEKPWLVNLIKKDHTLYALKHFCSACWSDLGIYDSESTVYKHSLIIETVLHKLPTYPLFVTTVWSYIIYTRHLLISVQNAWTCIVSPKVAKVHVQQKHTYVHTWNTRSRLSFATIKLHKKRTCVVRRSLQFQIYIYSI